MKEKEIIIKSFGRKIFEEKFNEFEEIETKLSKIKKLKL